MVNGNLGQDVFNRKTSVGWYGILGHSIFRPEPLIQIGSTSSLGALRLIVGSIGGGPHPLGGGGHCRRRL